MIQERAAARQLAAEVFVVSLNDVLGKRRQRIRRPIAFGMIERLAVTFGELVLDVGQIDRFVVTSLGERLAAMAAVVDSEPLEDPSSGGIARDEPGYGLTGEIGLGR